jgi:hypothetical protein
MNSETQEVPVKNKSSCLKWFLTIALILIAIIITVIPASMTWPRPAYEQRCKGTLRSIGSSEQAFSGNEGEGMYGSFEELKESQYIAESYTRDNMIDRYSLSWSVHNEVIAPGYGYPGIINTFTIIAYPDTGSPKYLHTFAVTEDQIVRQYTPENDNEIGSVKTWDPIL